MESTATAGGDRQQNMSLPERNLKTIHTQTNHSQSLSTSTAITQNIMKEQKYMILSTDKGLGPVGVTTKQYMEWSLKHILDNSTYTLLSESTALKDCDALYRSIFQWTLTCKYRKDIGTDATKYIQHKTEKARADPFGYFYLFLAKLHKSPVSTRPVCSNCASLQH